MVRSETSSGVVRVLLVEDHVSLREALAHMLEQDPGFEITGQAGTVAQAKELAGIGVDVAVVDLGLPDGDGKEVIEVLSRLDPSPTVLVLTASLNQTDHARAVLMGAAKVMHKSATPREISDAVRRLASGETLPVPAEMFGLMHSIGRLEVEGREVATRIQRLTKRELQILQAMAEGLDSEQIAALLGINVLTERKHVGNILAKLGVRSRLQALVLAVRHGATEIRPSADR